MDGGELDDQFFGQLRSVPLRQFGQGFGNRFPAFRHRFSGWAGDFDHRPRRLLSGKGRKRKRLWPKRKFFPYRARPKSRKKGSEEHLTRLVSVPIRRGRGIRNRRDKGSRNGALREEPAGFWRDSRRWSFPAASIFQGKGCRIPRRGADRRRPPSKLPTRATSFPLSGFRRKIPVTQVLQVPPKAGRRRPSPFLSTRFPRTV